MEQARLFQALSDGTRLSILELLSGGPMNVSGLVGRLGCAQPAVSRHLRVLREVALIHDSRRGKEVEYSLDRDNLVVAVEFLRRISGSVGGRGTGGDAGSRGKPGRKPRRKPAGRKAAGRGASKPPVEPKRVVREESMGFVVERRADDMDDFLL